MFTFSASFICSALDLEQEAANTTNAQSARALKIFFIIVSVMLSFIPQKTKIPNFI
jgi:hypothetical protein